MMREPICKCPTCIGEGVRICPRCEGAGAVSGPLGARVCPRCEGEKRIACQPCYGSGLRALAPLSAASWPKGCSCCDRLYTADMWQRLAYVGVQAGAPGDPGMEMRNCPCGNTLVVELPRVA